MINKEPSIKDMSILWKTVSEFIEDNICCEEDIHQSERVSEKSYELIEELCDIVGFPEL